MNTQSMSYGFAKYDFSIVNDFTIEFFVRVNEAYDKKRVLMNSGDKRATGTQNAEIAIGPDLKIGIRTEGNCYGGPGSLKFSNTPLEIGEVYHVAITGNNNETYIYINGIIDSKNLKATTRCGRNFKAVVLGYFESNHNGVKGDTTVQIEFPRVWSRILTSDEILKSSNNKTNLLENQTDLIFYDTFENGEKINRITGVIAEKDSWSEDVGQIFSDSLLIEKRMLLLKNKKYYYYNGSSFVESIAKNKEDIKVHGMKTLKNIPKNELQDFVPFSIEFFVDTEGVIASAKIGRTSSSYKKDDFLYEGKSVVLIKLDEVPTNKKRCIIYIKGKNMIPSISLSSNLEQPTQIPFEIIGDIVKCDLDLTNAPFSTTLAYEAMNPLCLQVKLEAGSTLESYSYSWY